MTIFDYLMVLISIVLALGVTQILTGLSKLLRSQQRYAPVGLWGIALFLVHAQFWWALWDTRQVTEWNQFSFLYILLIPCSLFAATELLLPSSSSTETDWKVHFNKIRTLFFGAYVTFHVLAASFTWILLEIPLTHPYRIAQTAMTAVLLAGMGARGPHSQKLLPMTYLVIVIVSQLYFRLFPVGL